MSFTPLLTSFYLDRRIEKGKGFNLIFESMFFFPLYLFLFQGSGFCFVLFCFKEQSFLFATGFVCGLPLSQLTIGVTVKGKAVGRLGLRTWGLCLGGAGRSLCLRALWVSRHQNQRLPSHLGQLPTR